MLWDVQASGRRRKRERHTQAAGAHTKGDVRHADDTEYTEGDRADPRSNVGEELREEQVHDVAAAIHWPEEWRRWQAAIVGGSGDCRASGVRDKRA